MKQNRNIDEAGYFRLRNRLIHMKNEKDTYRRQPTDQANYTYAHV